MDEDTIKFDHLERQKKGHRNWIRGKRDDVQVVNLIQVIPVSVVGEWNFHSERHPVFVLENDKEITIAFENYK